MEQVYPKQEKKLTAKEAGTLNGVSAKTMIRWARSGLPHFFFGRQYLFYQSEVEKFMVKHFGANRNVYELPVRSTASH